MNRLDLSSQGGQGLPELVGGMQKSGAKGKTKGALDAAGEKLSEVTGGKRDQRSRRSSDREED